LKEISFVPEYQQRETDPYQRILNLKKELIETKIKIDEYAQRFHDNQFIKQTENLNKVIEELDLYKTKIDAFINYDIFNHLFDDESDLSYDSDKSTTPKVEYQSLFDKYNRLTENLLSQIKLNENDIINNNFGDLNVKYEIFANPEMHINTLINRLNELEGLINDLEKNIGNWHIVLIIILLFSIITMKAFALL
jgi:hypothetical protein